VSIQNLSLENFERRFYKTSCNFNDFNILPSVNLNFLSKLFFQVKTSPLREEPSPQDPTRTPGKSQSLPPNLPNPGSEQMVTGKSERSGRIGRGISESPETSGTTLERGI
jgi:hypothetical protein